MLGVSTFRRQVVTKLNEPAAKPARCQIGKQRPHVLIDIRMSEDGYVGIRVTLNDCPGASGVVMMAVDDGDDGFVAKGSLHFQRFQPGAQVLTGVDHDEAGLALDEGVVGDTVAGDGMDSGSDFPSLDLRPRAVGHK